MRFLISALAGFLVFGCSSAPKKPDPVVGALKAVEVKGPVELKLKADPEKKELVMYVSRTTSANLSSGQTPKEVVEETRFATESSTAYLKNGLISMSIATVDKEGKLDLNHIALPEFGRVLRLVMRPNGQIVQAGTAPKNSIFYVAPVSLPNQPVQVGETWATKENWVSQSDKTPMVMDSVSILRGVVACGTDQCADIEISGDVDVEGGLQNVNFKSHWTGRLLFAINAGTVLWSRTDSLETLQAENASTRVQSCLESVLVKPDTLKLAHLNLPKCDPAEIPGPVKP